MRFRFNTALVIALIGLLWAPSALSHPDAEHGAEQASTVNPAFGDWRPFEKPVRGFDPKGNLELVPNASFDIGNDQYGPIVRVNMLKIDSWSSVPGISKVWKACYPNPNEGDNFSNLILSEVIDVDGDGTFHAFCCIDWYKSHIARYDDQGNCLWVSAALPRRAGDESRLPVLDIDNDGTLEVLSVQQYREDGGGAVVCLDGETGQTEWLTRFAGGVQKVLENPMTVGHYTNSEEYDIAARIDNVLYCLDCKGELRWKRQLTDAYDYGHELYGYDVDGDGIEELFVSTETQMTALRGDGSILWQDDTSLGHSDFIACGDVDEDGKIEVIYDHDGCGGKGPLYIVDALTGEVEATIDYFSSGLRHAQGGVVGKFRSDLKGLQVFLNDKISGIYLFGNQGELLWKEKAPGSLASCGDWDGDGDLEALCFALGTNRDGIFSVWDGNGKRKYAISFLPSPLEEPGISHAAPAGHIGRLRQSDLDGDGKADVVMSFGRWGNSPHQFLFIMSEPTSAFSER